MLFLSVDSFKLLLTSSNATLWHRVYRSLRNGFHSSALALDRNVDSHKKIMFELQT